MADCDDNEELPGGGGGGGIGGSQTIQSMQDHDTGGL